MSKLVESIFGVNLQVMQILGFYPPQKYTGLYKFYSLIVYVMFTILIPVLPTVYLIMDPETNLDKIADSAFITCQLGCFIIKMIPFLVKEDEIRKSIYMIEHPQFCMYTKDQENIIHDCRKTCKRTSWVFLIFCAACIVVWGLTPFLEKEYRLPIDAWLPYDFTTSSRRYFLSCLYLISGGANGAISNGALDSLISGLTYYATSQIKILKDNLEHLSEYASTAAIVEKEKSKCEIIGEQIKHCINHHNVIIEYIANLQNVYSSVVFTQFSASVLVICICCFKLSQVDVFSITFVWMSLFLVTMLSEIFLYCYFGTTLSEENNTLMQAVYMGKWYECDIQSQKALLILMERSRKPIVVTAGKILDLSLETFTTILRRAYSLLAVLKNY